MNTDCNYSAAYVILNTGTSSTGPLPTSVDDNLKGFGMTFTIGKGNDIVVDAIKQLADKLVGMALEDLFGDMGAMWELLTSDSQLRWIGPEKGVIHLATGAVANAVWDLFARSRKKPLWKLIVDMTPEEIVKCSSLKYLSDALSPEEAVQMLRERQSTKKDRERTAVQDGLRAYSTSVGWMGYTTEKVQRLTKQALEQGFNHFKLKVGVSVEDDLARAKVIRDIIDDPQYQNKEKSIDAKTIEGKNAGPTGK